MSEKIERKRTIKIRLSEKEFSNLQKDVARTGLSREAYLRTMIATRRPVTTREQAKSMRDVARELHSIGNNLNQIARLAHSNGWLRPERYDAAVADLQTALEKIRR